MIERIWAVDVEGNGGTPPQIIELAIVEIFGFTLLALAKLGECDRLVVISRTVSRIHGIWDRDLVNSPTIEEVSSDIESWIEGTPIVGHNVQVELEIIGRTLEDWRPPAAYDTLKLARMLVPNAEKYSLESLGKHFHLDNKAAATTNLNHHSALYDATLSAMLLFNFLGPLPNYDRSIILEKANVIVPVQAKLL